MASRATTVFPEPTSPWTRRFIGWGERMSSAISRSTRFWAPVRWKGRIRFTASRVRSPISKGIRLPLPSPRTPSAAPGEAQLEEEELLQDEPQVGGAAGAVQESRGPRSRPGRWIAAQGLCPSHDAEALAQLGGQRVGQVVRNLAGEAALGRAAAALPVRGPSFS